MKLTIFIVKMCCVAVFFGISFATSHSQSLQTEYWQLTKTYYYNGKVTVNNDRCGQFITRNNQICYDSDCKGFAVNNGTLKVVNNQGSVIKYAGSSYYGDESTYTFYIDDGILNIQDLSGNVYVYYRKSAPSGCTTSSLIRNGGGGIDIPTENGSSVGEKSSHHTSHDKKTRHPKVCRKCFGKGVCTKCNGTGTVYTTTYEANKYITCPACSGTRKCSLCNGKGTYGYDYY